LGDVTDKYVLGSSLNCDSDRLGISRICAEKDSEKFGENGETAFMTEMSQPLTRRRQLSVEDLKTLPFQMNIDGNQITLETGLHKNRLKQPVTLSLDKVLAAREIGLVEFVFKAMLSERPMLLQYVFENQSILRMARHFLRDCSGSIHSCYSYIQQTQQYTDWAGFGPDMMIADLKQQGHIVSPERLQNHVGFLSDYLADLQDLGLVPGVISNRIKAAKTFYRCNGAKVELTEKLSRRVTYKDRSPTPDELTKILDVAPLREKVIIVLLALGGFREETLSKLKYRHVREDLENNKIPIHVQVEIEIVKGKYGDYDTFLGTEATNYLKLYFEERKTGTRRLEHEVLTDDSPLIRDETSKTPKPIGPKQIRVLVHQLYVKVGLTKHRNGHYDLRTHSIRKYFKTQMTALGVNSDYVEYFMGHILSTYNDVQSLGIEKLRSIYSAAGLSIRQKTQISKLDQLKEMVRAFGWNPEQVLSQSALADGAITMQSSEDQQLAVLRKQLRELILAETSV
jgi:hypothetical protein